MDDLGEPTEWIILLFAMPGLKHRLLPHQPCVTPRLSLWLVVWSGHPPPTEYFPFRQQRPAHRRCVQCVQVFYTITINFAWHSSEAGFVELFLCQPMLQPARKKKDCLWPQRIQGIAQTKRETENRRWWTTAVTLWGRRRRANKSSPASMDETESSVFSFSRSRWHNFENEWLRCNRWRWA